MALIGYGRLSTKEQAEGQTREQQEHRLLKAGATRIYFDVASGSRDDRPQLTAALKALEQGAASGMVATRIDRLTRSASFNSRLCDFFGDDNGPRLVCLDDSVDTQSIMGRAMFRISGVFAQAEVERTRERTRHGLAHRRDVLGAHQGRAPFGYLRVPNQLQLVLDPATATIAAEVVDTFIATADAGATAEWLLDTHGIRIPPRSLRSWLQLPTLVGDSGRSHPRLTVKGKREPAKKGWLRIDPDTHPPIISRAKAADVALALAASARTTGASRRGKSQPSWYSSRFKCGSCDHTMRIHRERLICSNRMCPVRYAANSIELPALRRELLRGLFWLGKGLIARLAPEVAASSGKIVECPEAIEIRRKIASMQATGLAEVQPAIDQLQRELRGLVGRSDGFRESAAEATKRLNAAIGQWAGLRQLPDDDLLALLRDAEVIGVIHEQRLRVVVSNRWEPMVWMLDSDGGDLLLSTAELKMPTEKGEDPGSREEELGVLDPAPWFAPEGDVYLTVVSPG